MNTTIANGRLTADAIARKTTTVKDSKGNPVTLVNFTIADNNGRPQKDENGNYKKDTHVNYIKVTIGGPFAESVLPYLKKGRNVQVEGTMYLDTWKGNDGAIHPSLAIRDVNPRKFQFLDRKPAEGAPETPAPTEEDAADIAEEELDSPF